MNRISNSSMIGTTTCTSLFKVSDEETDRMIECLSLEFGEEEVQKLSRCWIKEIMIQPKKSKRRTFEYSRHKLRMYLSWRRDCDITRKISHHLKDSQKRKDCGEIDIPIPKNSDSLSQLASNGLGGLYWYGIDKAGSPILWYHANQSNFGKMNVANEMEFISLLMTAAFDVMPSHIYNLNFIMILDECCTKDVLKRPNLVPNFVKTMMKVCPDRLKRAYVISGGLGEFFYTVAKRIAPAKVMEKVCLSSSRLEVSKVLVGDGVLKQAQVPNFMGGTFIHDEQIRRNFCEMIQILKMEMQKSSCS